jgi:hypothetical protein
MSPRIIFYKSFPYLFLGNKPCLTTTSASCAPLNKTKMKTKENLLILGLAYHLAMRVI